MSDIPAWLRYANQGATRNQPLSPDLVNALAFLGDMGITAEVFSGGQEGKGEGTRRTGSTRHDHGGAADVLFYQGDRMLDWANPNDQPLFQDIVKRARAAGITGIGAGDGYMRPGSMHIGFGPEAVWGAGGSGANAPAWLREAFGAPLGPGHSAGDGHNHGTPNVGFSGAAAMPAAGGAAAPALSAMFGDQSASPLPGFNLGDLVTGGRKSKEAAQPNLREQQDFERRKALADLIRY